MPSGSDDAQVTGQCQGLQMASHGPPSVSANEAAWCVCVCVGGGCCCHSGREMRQPARVPSNYSASHNRAQGYPRPEAVAIEGSGSFKKS